MKTKSAKNAVNAFACSSGGKDSVLAFYEAQKQGIKVARLLNTVSSDGKRSRFHEVPARCLRLQSEAIDIPIIQPRASGKKYEDKFQSVLSSLKNQGIESGIFGDIDIEEHRGWVEKVCGQVGIRPIFPLWKKDRGEILQKFIREGFQAIVVTTQADRMDEGWLGRKIDRDFVRNLRQLVDVDLCGERGEYHTLVTDGPIFKKRINIKAGKKTFRKIHGHGYWFLDISNAVLNGKGKNHVA